MIHVIEMRHTVDVGMNKTFSSSRDEPFPTKSLTVPMPSSDCRGFEDPHRVPGRVCWGMGRV